MDIRAYIFLSHIYNFNLEQRVFCYVGNTHSWARYNVSAIATSSFATVPLFLSLPCVYDLSSRPSLSLLFAPTSAFLLSTVAWKQVLSLGADAAFAREERYVSVLQIKRHVKRDRHKWTQSWLLFICAHKYAVCRLIRYEKIVVAMTLLSANFSSWHFGEFEVDARICRWKPRRRYALTDRERRRLLAKSQWDICYVYTYARTCTYENISQSFAAITCYYLRRSVVRAKG